jgi:hypothetical protein
VLRDVKENQISGEHGSTEFLGQMKNYDIFKQGPVQWSWLVGWLVSQTICSHELCDSTTGKCLGAKYTHHEQKRNLFSRR